MIPHCNGIPISIFNPVMLQLACDVRMLNLKDVSEGTGVDLRRLERFVHSHGFTRPTVDEIERIADMLRFPWEFFYREGSVFPPVYCPRAGNDDLPVQLPLF